MLVPFAAYSLGFSLLGGTTHQAVIFSSFLWVTPRVIRRPERLPLGSFGPCCANVTWPGGLAGKLTELSAHLEPAELVPGFLLLPAKFAGVWGLPGRNHGQSSFALSLTQRRI